MATFFTADLHLFHRNIIDFCGRPFDNLEQMHDAIIQNWNLTVKEKDTTYLLGDSYIKCSPKQAVTILSKLNGHLVFLPGDHDLGLVEAVRLLGLKARLAQWIEVVHPSKVTNGIDIPQITLCHYPMRRWPKSHYGTWHLFGHVHGGMKSMNLGKSFDVGTDCHGFVPLSVKAVAGIMERLPDNENLIRKR